MERRKVDILCVQETRWKGSKARSIGAGFKLFYYGVDSKRNGVGVVLKEEFVWNVLEVKRVSDRVMSLKLEIEGVMLNVVSGYAPQVGCELEEKERFWSELDEVMESIPTGERVVIGADFNGHVGEGNTGDEEVMGKFGVKERNLEGQMVVDFAKRMDMGVVNTYFQKREEHRVTYKSGGRSTQVDYILCRRGNLKEISDCKVVVGESVARQHRMVVCRMTLMVCKTKRSKIEKKTKWWKLKKEECCEEFRQKLRQALGGQVVLPDDWETTAEVIRETGRKVLGVSSGRRKEDKETWWWNEEVQDSIQRKRLAKKKWDMDRTEENRQEYKELQRRVKREVSKAKQKAYEELYTRLDTREGEKDLYRLARQRDRDGKDVQQVRVIKDRDGRVLTSEESVQRRWKEYFEELMNEENEREKRVEGVNSVEQKVDKIRKDEVRKALKRMKSGKAVGPDDIPVEVWKCLGEAAVEFLANLFNRVLESERMPEEWRRSVLVPIFKNKGDVQSCSNYRGIKLMSHTMKVWERVVEARLRKVVDIYLEKAYDRVPREELWYCMRKSGVAEKYIRVVQDMYERSRTVVRCAVVMDQLSEEVRQESPWTMMFADDIVICSESREQVEENLERWRFALERRGMKVSRIQSNGECGKEVKKRVQAETVSLRKRQESELEVAELKMLRFSLGVTRLDRIRNEYIRGTAHVGRLGDKVREARLRWFGHVQRRDMGARVEDAEDRDRWREMIRSTQVSASELQDVFQETSSNIFQINANVVTLEKSLQSLGTSRDTAELRQSLHSIQQQNNKVITSTSQLIKQLSDIIIGSSRQDRLRLTRLKTELSESVQRYGDLQKKIADRSRALLPSAQKDRKQSQQTPITELCEDPLVGPAETVEGDEQQAFLSEISEEDVEVLRQREEALLQIEVCRTIALVLRPRASLLSRTRGVLKWHSPFITWSAAVLGVFFGCMWAVAHLGGVSGDSDGELEIRVLGMGELRDMLDVNQIMKDLASMVHEQGDTIDSIEEYIQTTASHVESANQELAKASHYQCPFSFAKNLVLLPHHFSFSFLSPFRKAAEKKEMLLANRWSICYDSPDPHHCSVNQKLKANRQILLLHCCDLSSAFHRPFCVFLSYLFCLCACCFICVL
ncbi:hypothetical protein QTP86_032612 [Hemibagrus guttatus]|nr:hypothetical protein QTP86_032612 [Hemibagrus guttatus]